MASDTTTALLMKLIEVGVPLALDKLKQHTGKDLSQQTHTEAILGLRAIQIRSIEELEEEGRRRAEEDDDGA